MANYEPESPTGRMKAARRHRAKAYAARNELLALLARSMPAHIMPSKGALKTLSERMVLCIHPPDGKPIAWVITSEEAEDHFATIAHIAESHWDGAKQDERTNRINALVLPIVTENAEAPVMHGRVRCTSVGPKPDKFQCGLDAGHEGKHSADIPPNAPWANAPAIVMPAPKGPAKKAATKAVKKKAAPKKPTSHYNRTT